MSKKIDDLVLLEQALLGLKAQMGYVFAIMEEIDVLGLNKDIKNSSKEEIAKIRDIDNLFDEVNYFWKNTRL